MIEEGIKYQKTKSFSKTGQKILPKKSFKGLYIIYLYKYSQLQQHSSNSHFCGHTLL